MSENTSRVMAEIAAERARQDAQWGGPEHDDSHESAEWWEFIYYQYRNVSAQTHRERLVKVAALAVAAIESYDRKAKGGLLTNPHTGEPRDYRDVESDPEGVLIHNPAEPLFAGKPKYTTGHCQNRKQPGGCHLHNLHCRYPECDRRPVQGKE